MQKKGVIHRQKHHPVIRQKKNLSLAQKSADVLTKYCGSWIFIFGLSFLLAVWMAINLVAFFNHWDPYPFILLNLVLSCLATYQAPIILMSQNRASERDRTFAQYDYKVNRKAEREISNMQQDLEIIKKMITNCTKRCKKP